MPSAATRSSSMGGADIEFALDLEDIAARAAKADCIGALACGRASFSYHRLPEPPLRLTVRKLDDSYFDVRIARSAAVWELKAAIQGVFVALYHDMENAVTWQHVWSHFCLCFKDEKMTDDKATLRAFGIKDGDEMLSNGARAAKFHHNHLHFAQHLSVDYSPCKSSKSQRATSHRRSRTSVEDSSVRPRNLMDDLIEEDKGEKKLIATRHSMSILDEDLCIYEHHEEHVEEDRKKGISVHGWFSYSRLRGNRRTHSENIVQPSCEKGSRPKLGKWLSSKMTKARSK